MNQSFVKLRMKYLLNISHTIVSLLSAIRTIKALFLFQRFEDVRTLMWLWMVVIDMIVYE
jgi:hypothetical protein